MEYTGYLVLFATLIGCIYCGQECLSCFGIPDPLRCRETVHCHNDEVCFMHNYTTDNNDLHYDLGCTYPELCPSGSSAPIVGRRDSETHHEICQGCCNHTNICNMDLTCYHDSNGGNQNQLPVECSDLPSNASGVYVIYPRGEFHPVLVYCVVENGNKWTVIQRRINGHEDFYRGWNAYRDGFGSAHDEYWLGNDNFHLITSSKAHELAVLLEDFSGERRWANYSFAFLGDERSNYPLYVSEYSGNSGDTLSYSNSMPFSTYDRDNGGRNCAVKHHGAWWYSTCGYSNLNGKYMTPASNGGNLTGMFWYAWHGFNYSYKETTIMIKKK